VLERLSDDNPLLPLSQFLFAEAALAAGKDRAALDHLQLQGVDWPDVLLIPRKLRIADAHAGLGQLDKAIQTYRDLAEEPGLFDYYRFSSNRAAFSAFKNGNYLFASEVYRKLITPLEEAPGDDLLLFAAGAAAYEAGDLGWGMIGLQRATLDRPDTEGGDRAALRLLDIKILKGGELVLAQTAAEYAKLGEKSQFRPVREEARFKHALALYLLGDNQESLEKLMRFRREFGSSQLIREADLLILQQLPTVVHRLLEQKNDLQAVVLAEQNRKLLLRSGFDKEFLRDLATAFDRLGLYERAGRVLLYLFDRTAGKPEQELIYLPLAQSYLKRAEYQKASEYAERYLKKFPHGEDAGALFSILLDAFERNGHSEELLSWLDREDRPSSRDLEIRAAHIYWKAGRLPSMVECLRRADRFGGAFEVKEMALLAEGYYQLGKNLAAEKIYRKLFDDPLFGVQARYRTAQLLLRQQQRRAALALLEKLVETDGDDPWGKLAQDLLTQETR
jgi:tetratricopeptide (TPR) repeat protein